MSPTAPKILLEAYLEKRGMLVRYFTARARDPGIAEEVVQDIYLKIAALPADYKVDNPTAFLFTAGSNIWLNRLRSHGRERARDGQWVTATHMEAGGEMVADSPSAEAELSARQQIAQIDRALQDLPEKTRRIFHLIKIDGMTQAQAAQHLGISKSSVEKHQYAALRHLASRLGDAHGP